MTVHTKELQTRPIVAVDIISVAHATVDIDAGTELRGNEDISDIYGASGDLLSQGDYSTGLAERHEQRSRAIGKFIKVLEDARDQYDISSQMLKEVSPVTEEEATNLRLLGDRARVLNFELETLITDEQRLMHLIATQEETIRSCREVLAITKDTIINSSLYSNEQPAEAYEAAALALANRDSSNLFAQSAAASYEPTMHLLAMGNQRLAEQREKIAQKQAELHRIITFSEEYADKALEIHGTRIATAKRLGTTGLRGAGAAIADEDIENLLTAALMLHLNDVSDEEEMQQIATKE